MQVPVVAGEVDKGPSGVLVHYLDTPSTYDEWLPIDRFMRKATKPEALEGQQREATPKPKPETEASMGPAFQGVEKPKRQSRSVEASMPLVATAQEP